MVWRTQLSASRVWRWALCAPAGRQGVLS